MATCQRSDQGQNSARPRIQASSIDNTKAPMSRPSEVLPRRLNEGDQAMEAAAAAQRTQAQEDRENAEAMTLKLCIAFHERQCKKLTFSTKKAIKKIDIMTHDTCNLKP